MKQNLLTEICDSLDPHQTELIFEEVILRGLDRVRDTLALVFANDDDDNIYALRVVARIVDAVNSLEMKGNLDPPTSKRIITDVNSKYCYAINTYLYLDKQSDAASNEDDIDFLEEYRKFVEYSHLALVWVFEYNGLLGKKKRQKILFLFQFPEYRRIAVEKRMAELKGGQDPPAEVFVPHPIPLRMTIALQHGDYGMYDKLMDDFVDKWLIDPEYLHVIRGTYGGDAIEITDDGRARVHYLLKNDPDFKDYIAIAKELKLFDGFTNNEMEKFIKTYVVQDWDTQVEKWGYYRWSRPGSQH
jgi:hypothetical protein